METILLALEHDCPFCGAVAGQACRTRNSGRDQSHPHSRRMALTTPKDERKTPRVNALCCICGELRTVSEHYWTKRDDPNAGHSPLAKENGWRSTKTLKCAACGEPTRHAVLRRADCAHRDSDEAQQRIALGDPDTGPYGRYTDLERVRREYREMPFPRNPYLTHRRWNADAQKAWDDGTKKVIALCGEPIEVKVDPRQAKKYADTRNDAGYLVAEIVSDIELTDPETGLEWVDMDCVDCCRVANVHHVAEQRRWLEKALAWFASKPECIEDHEVSALVATLEGLAEIVRNQAP